MVWFDTAMVKSFYKLPEKDIKAAVGELIKKGILTVSDGGYLLTEDVRILETYQPESFRFVYAIHRNDFLYKSQEHILKEKAKEWTAGLEYDHAPLQYLLIDGEFHGASVGHFRNGPYDLNDVVCDLPDWESRRDEIIAAIEAVNYGHRPKRIMGEILDEA